MTNLTQSELLVRARAVADSGDAPKGVNLCREYLGGTPDAREVAELAVHLLVSLGEGPQAIDLCLDLAIALPDAIWPWALACEPLAVALAEREPQAAEAARAQAADPGADPWAAMQAVRKFLALAMWWPQLSRHLTLMADKTWRISEQVSIWDELVDVIANKLSDPLAAREARMQAEQWRDVPTLVQTYWHGLELKGDDPAMWDEAETFFRINGLYSDLIRLLEASLDGADDAERVKLWTEIVDVYLKLPEVDFAMVDAALAHDDRPNGPPQIRDLRARLEKERVARELAKKKAMIPVDKGTFSLPPALVAAIALAIGVVIATFLVINAL